jgi:hypothetical protein
MTPLEPLATRRAFGRKALETLTTVSLLECLAATRLFGQDVAPKVADWVKQLDQIGHELKDHKLQDVEFQKSLEDLYKKVDLQALLKTLDFERLAKEVEFPKVGAKSLPVAFNAVAGLPRELVFGRQMFAMTKGRSVVPHGHDNMATGFLVLKGTFRGRHWDRVEDNKDHYIIKPTIDHTFETGGCSTISDHKDNVHWFTAESDVGFIFNIHVVGYNAENPKPGNRVYVDPLGEKLAGGLVKAPKITYGEANRKYG